MKSVWSFQKSALNSGIFKFLFVSGKIEVINNKFVNTYSIAFSVLNYIMEQGVGGNGCQGKVISSKILLKNV